MYHNFEFSERTRSNPFSSIMRSQRDAPPAYAESAIMREACDEKFYALALADYLKASAARLEAVLAAAADVMSNIDDLAPTRDGESDISTYAENLVVDAIRQYDLEDYADTPLQLDDTHWTTPREVIRSAAFFSEAAAEGKLNPGEVAYNQLEPRMQEAFTRTGLPGEIVIDATQLTNGLNPTEVLDKLSDTLQAAYTAASAFAATCLETAEERISQFKDSVSQRFKNFYTTMSNTGAYYLDLLRDKASNVSGRVTNILNAIGFSSRADSQTASIQHTDMHQYCGASPLPATDLKAVGRGVAATGYAVAQVTRATVSAIIGIGKKLFNKAKSWVHSLFVGAPIEQVTSDVEAACSFEGWTTQVGGLQETFAFQIPLREARSVVETIQSWINDHADKWIKYHLITGEILFRYGSALVRLGNDEHSLTFIFTNVNYQWKPHAIDPTSVVQAYYALYTDEYQDANVSTMPRETAVQNDWCFAQNVGAYAGRRVIVHYKDGMCNNAFVTRRYQVTPGNYGDVHETSFYTTRRFAQFLARIKDNGYKLNLNPLDEDPQAYLRVAQGLATSYSLTALILWGAAFELNPYLYEYTPTPSFLRSAETMVSYAEFYSHVPSSVDIPTPWTFDSRWTIWGGLYNGESLGDYVGMIGSDLIIPNVFKAEPTSDQDIPTNKVFTMIASGWNGNADVPMFGPATAIALGIAPSLEYYTLDFPQGDWGDLTDQDKAVVADDMEDAYQEVVDAAVSMFDYIIKRSMVELIAQPSTAVHGVIPAFVPYRDNVADFDQSRWKIRTDQQNQRALTTFLTVVVTVVIVAVVALSAKLIVNRIKRAREFKRTEFVGRCDNAMWNGAKMSDSDRKRYLRYKKKGLAGDAVSGSNFLPASESIFSNFMDSYFSSNDNPEEMPTVLKAITG